MPNEEPMRSMEFSDFPGIVLLQDTTDLAPGAAQDQVNVKSDVKGQLTCRGGMLPVTFDYSA